MTADGPAIGADELERLQQHAGKTARLLKALSNRDRLQILCCLAGADARTVMNLLYRLYCADRAGAATGTDRVGARVPATPAGG